MKKFKIEKSRSTLWRESRDENDADDLAQVHEADDLSYRTSTLGSRDVGELEQCEQPDNVSDVSENEGYLSDKVVTAGALEGEGGLESSLRWLNDDDEESECEDSLTEQLAAWSVEHNITTVATGELLSILKPHLPFLPKSSQTLRKTLRSTSHLMKGIGGGEYCYLSLSSGLTTLVKQNQVTTEHLELQINVDGIPLFKSSSVTLWPILCLVKNISFRAPFVVGMFCGKEKPHSASEFLSDFVKEACMLVKDGLTVDHDKKVITIHSFVCDAPARAFVKGIKYPSGYSSCEKCTIHGEYDGKVIFKKVDCPLRTDDSFNAMVDDEHHVNPCPLQPLPVGYVSQFGLDYMHLTCLGVMRRLILCWKGPVGPLQVRLSRRVICDLSSRLLHLRQFVPVEFARKPRSLDEILRWKATEFREFMLYSGMLVLRHILVDDLYQHFLLLFVSIRILVSQHLSQLYCDYAHELLVKFVSDAAVLYGNDILVYNVHCLIHLANDVKRLGCLEEFSAFTFENKLGQLKKLVHKPQQPLQQIIRRLHEETSLEVHGSNIVVEPILLSQHHDGPIVHGLHGASQYRRVRTNKFTLSISSGNNCVLLDGCIPATVKNILKTANGIMAICVKFETVQDAFMTPLPSSWLNIYHVAGMTDDLFLVSLSDIVHKCVCWPLLDRDNLVVDDETFLILPLLHQV